MTEGVYCKINKLKKKYFKKAHFFIYHDQV